MRVPLLDLKREYAGLRSQVDAAIANVFDNTNFINGKQVTELEQAVAKYLGCKHAVGVASGTDALLLALRAAGVGPGDEVITTPFSFFATAGAIANAGAKPVFVDIDGENFNIDASQIEKAVTPKTKVIMPVNLFGQSADLDPIMEVARKHGVKVIEDAAQSISARYKDRMSGTVGDFGCFSFYPTKNLGAAGDGGMIVTNDDESEAVLRKLKFHGGTDEYHHDLIGFNSRLDTVQAALLLVKLPHLDEWSDGRRANARFYTEAFGGLNVKTPKVEDYAHHIFNQYTLNVDGRDDLAGHLKAKEVGCKVYYPKPLHLQPCFGHLGYKKGDFPVAERTAERAISIPIYPQLSTEERDFVVAAIAEFLS
jgi:dTDP-4-amino-4,6-dideoxygalactose transaminase